MFDVEKAIRAWRRGYEYRRAFTQEDLKELECHLRDQIDSLRAEGLPERDAFEQAVRDVGDYATTEDEYRKVYWEKAHHQGNLIPELIWQAMMLKNYIKIALRNFKRSKSYTVLNVSGLALGMACFLLVLLFVQDELAYDRHHEHAEDIYRIVKEVQRAGAPASYVSATPMGLPAALEQQFPNIEQAARLMAWTDEAVFLRDGQYLTTGSLYLADPDIFDVFTIPFVKGNPATALSRPGTMVITEQAAAQHFSDGDPIGQVITFDQGQFQQTYEITGIVADLPRQSHFRFDFLGTMADGQEGTAGVTWNRMRGATYARLTPGTDPAVLEAKLADFATAAGGEGHRLWLQPLTGIHLHSHLEDELETNSDIRYVYIFSLTALLMLLIACINFTNLSTAQALRRGKEVGVRKVLGAQRRQLVQQFLGEAIMLAVLALPLAVGLVALALPGFNHLVNKHLTLQDSGPGLWLITLGVTLVVGLVAGSYGAVLLSRFRPEAALKGTLRTGSLPGLVRKGLVVVQFSVSIALIAATLIINEQLGFISDQRLGFNEEHVLVVPAAGVERQQLPAFKDEILKHSGVVAATASNWVPGENRHATGHGDGPDGKDIPFIIVDADADFFTTLQMPVKHGRSFGPAELDELAAGTFRFGYGRKALVNEQLLRRLEINPEDALGEPLNIPGIGMPEVIGVLEDFHITSLHHEIVPLAFRLSPTPPFPSLLIRVQPEQTRTVLAHAEQTWSQFSPAHPFDFFFLDDSIQQLYTAEQRLARIFSLLAGLAILIACLGLFGLAAYMAQQRRSEIGIRKVMGASLADIVLLFSGSFTRLVFVAFVLAAPVAYLVMSRWLDDFAYRVDISATVFLMAGLTAFGIALLSISYQSLRAALVNPVDTIRHE